MLKLSELARQRAAQRKLDLIERLDRTIDRAATVDIRAALRAEIADLELIAAYRHAEQVRRAMPETGDRIRWHYEMSAATAEIDRLEALR